MKKPVDLLIIAGEPSGDAHGQKLIQNLKKARPSLHIAAVGGPNIRKEEVEILLPMEKLSVMGFFDVFLALPRLIYLWRSLRKKIETLQPKAVLFIDYPEFNLRLARSLKKRGFSGKNIHYICPSVWAWGKKRIKIMEKALDLLLTIFPFEEDLFTKSSLTACYTGNPSQIAVQSHKKNGAFLEKYPSNIPLLGLFPGSRKKEIIRNLPWQIRAAKKMGQHAAIALSDKKHQKLIENILKKEEFKADLIFPEERFDLMERVDQAIATSGTVTLELALFSTPTLVVFAIRTVDYLIAAKCLGIDLPFYCIVNILEEKAIFPELFGPNLTPSRIDYWTKQFLQNPQALARCKEDLEMVKKKLTKKSASLSKRILLEIGV